MPIFGAGDRGKAVDIAEFKAKCERRIGQTEHDGEPIELTRRGKVIGILSLPPRAHEPVATAFGMLRGDRYRFDDPFAPAPDLTDRDAANPAGSYRR